MMESRHVISHDLSEVTFGVYKEEEILKLSVVRIVTPVTYDRLGNPLPGGLYDPAMGPLDGRTACVTCGLTMRDCPGHMGHLPLTLQVFNPMTLMTLHQILRLKCFKCHGFRLTRLPCRVLAAKLMLIDSGALEEAERFDEQYFLAENKDGLLSRYEKRMRTTPAADWTSAEGKAVRKGLIKAFFSEVLACRVCDRCGMVKTAVRKDGFTKFFVKERQGWGQQKSALQQVQGREASGEDALESASEAEEDDEEEEGLADGKPSRTKSGAGGKGARMKDKYMAPVEVQMHLKLLWEEEPVLSTLLWGRSYGGSRRMVGLGNKEAWRLFFWRVLPIPPSRFRPAAKNDDGSMAEHAQNYNIIKIMNHDQKVRSILSNAAAAESQEEGAADSPVGGLSPEDTAKVLSTWIDLQNAVNAYIDSSKDANAKMTTADKQTPGIRQGLEKKEGLFRMHMMGKRVNFACRSVISPDPYIGTSEIGLPLRFAQVLTYPQPVTAWNVVALRKLVENGPSSYPGANFVEDSQGRLVDLRKMNSQKRKALAARLLTPPGQKVWRQLHDGDVVLMNRQPTLHKPGIMAHHARVLRNPSAQTIRMHYANCNTYNADFDGDEMNCHLPQDELSRAEAELIACTNEQYIVPTNGKPLRGLIQDHVCSGVKLTSKDCFLTEDEFQQLVYVTLSGLPRVEIVPPEGRIDMPPPTIWKPRGLWTGKQVVSTILRHLTVRLPPLNLDFKAKTPPTAFGADQEEHQVLFRGGELLRGVLDKAAFGASEGGLVHGVYEFYGPHFAGKLLTALGRLFTVYLQFAGHTCGIEDLVLTKEADRKRKQLISRAGALGAIAMQCHTSGKSFSAPPSSEPIEPPDMDVIDTVRDKTAALYEEDVRTGTVTQGASIDNFMRTVLSPLSSEVIKACLPDGLNKPFPHNAFGLMVSTGAKGSTVNQSQVSCGLGQQELEGRRVPLMPSGKSLPSFPPYDPTPRAGGYITDRFLTGIRPQEYYFHCMAGREGLIDTAVKTSRSGYLQRCLVKGLEELRVHYDHTVRDGDARVVQFLYGEDGIDPIHSKYLDGKPVQMTALARNFEALVHKYGVDHGFLDRTGMDLSTARAWHEEVERATKGEQQSALGVGSFVHAKRLKRGRDQWISGLWKEGWEPAEIIKVHKPKPDRPYPTYDLRYHDGSVAKRVPGTVDAPPQTTNEGIAIYNKSAKKVVMIKPAVPDPVLARACLGTHLGAVSERFQAAIDTYVREDPERLVADGHLTEEGLQLLLWLKYLRSLAAPGEAVGAIAAQSIGEPSTQMTLNTFHLAGHGGANVTLGIPRMREIIMSASQNIKTPAMTVSFRPGVTREQATRVASRLRTLRFSELILHEAGGVEVTERLVKSEGPSIRLYEVRLRLYEEEAIQQTFGLSYEKLYDVAKRVLLLRMLAVMSAELRKFSSSSDDITVGAGRKRKSKANDEYDASQPTEEADEVELDLEDVGKSKPKGGDDMGDEDEDEEENEDEDEAQGTLKFGRRQEDVEYEADEPEEEQDQDATEEATGTTPQGEGGENAEAEAGTDATSQATTMDVDRERVAEGETKLDSAGTESTREGRPKKGKGRRTPAVTTEVLPSSIADNAYFKDVHMDLETGVLTVTLKTVASCRRLLMVNVVEAALEKTVVLATNGIQQAYVVEGQGSGGGLKLQTEGCNFEELWDGADKHLDLNSIMSNDIWRVHQTYGVEAARATIVKEISGVFGVYGIAVDPRHLGLVADFMTYRGGFRALNRNGMSQSSSPFLQMSFETTANFLMEAALAAEKDKLVTPSAKLVVGQPTGNGTGSFSLMVPIPGMPIKRH